MVDPTLCTVISFIFISHAMLWMQTVDYKARQKMIGNYRIILGRFHGYTISVACVLILCQLFYADKGTFIHRINGDLILMISFVSILAVILCNVLDIIFDKHLPLIWKLVSPLGDYLFAFYFLFCGFKSFEAVKLHQTPDIIAHKFWSERFGHSALITLAVFPLFKRTSKMVFDTQIYGGIAAGMVATAMFGIDYITASNHCLYRDQ
eukprot:275954_1